MLKSAPFLLFDGNCAKAMKFYHKCLGGKLTLNKLGDTPLKKMFPKEKHNRIINANLISGSIDISSTDWMASPDYEPHRGNTYSIFVVGDDLHEFKNAFNKLSDNCEKNRYQSLHNLPIGLYGQFTDKFGVAWIFLFRKT